MGVAGKQKHNGGGVCEGELYGSLSRKGIRYKGPNGCENERTDTLSNIIYTNTEWVLLLMAIINNRSGGMHSPNGLLSKDRN